jgi:UPF0176 protein
MACHHCAGDARKHEAAAERQRQMSLARARGEAHLGADAAETAARNRAAKRARGRLAVS